MFDPDDFETLWPIHRAILRCALELDDVIRTLSPAARAQMEREAAREPARFDPGRRAAVLRRAAGVLYVAGLALAQEEPS